MDELSKIRAEINSLDEKIIKLLIQRIKLGKKIAKIKLKDNPSLKKVSKKALERKIKNIKREKEILRKVQARARHKLSQKFVIALFKQIIKETIRAEVEEIKNKYYKIKKL
ncbi:MAG: chorismate mutase [Candidatus Pacearchaeota archaeon]